MKEPKIFPPTMRTDKRYIVFSIISESKINYDDLKEALKSSIINLLGEVDASKSESRMIKNLYLDQEQQGVFECRNLYVEHIRASMSMVSMIGETRSILKIEGVTGTIKSAKTKYFKSLGDKTL